MVSSEDVSKLHPLSYQLGNQNITMNIQDFEKELKQIDPDLNIQINKNNPELAGIYYKNGFLTGIPSQGIYDEANGDYGVIAASGNMMRHRTRPEAIEIVKGLLEKIKTDPDYHDALLGVGEYSDENLGLGRK